MRQLIRTGLLTVIGVTAAFLIATSSGMAQTPTILDYDTAQNLATREAFRLVDQNLVPTGWRFVPFEGGTVDVRYQVEVQIPDYTAVPFVPTSPQQLYAFWLTQLPTAVDALMAKWRASYSIIGVHAYNTPLWHTLRVDGPPYGPSIRSRYRVDAATGAVVMRLDLLAGN